MAKQTISVTIPAELRDKVEKAKNQKRHYNLKGKPRDKSNARFTKQYTDEDFIEAVRIVLDNPTASASEVAEILGCNPRYATARLKELAEEDKLEGVMKGRSWAFRLKYEE